MFRRLPQGDLPTFPNSNSHQIMTYPPYPPHVMPMHYSHESDSDSMAEVAGPGPGPGPDGTSDDKNDEPNSVIAKDQKLPHALVGMSAGLKHLYAGKEDKRGRFKWQTSMPNDLGEPAENAETAKWALIVRHVKVYNDPSKVLAMHSILIQSPLLKEFLKPILKGYPGITVGLNQLEIGDSFEPLIHRWSELNAALEKLEKVGDFSPLSEEEVVKKQEEIAFMIKAAQGDKKDGDDSESSQDDKDDQEKAKDTNATQERQDGRDHSPTTEDVARQQNDTTNGELVPQKEVDGEDKPNDAAKDGDSIKPTEKTQNVGDFVDKLLQPGESLSDSKDTIKLRHAKLLVELLTKEFQHIIESSQDMSAKGVMTYEHVWTLFQPGTLVYCRQEGQDRVFKLVNSRYGKDRQGNACYMLTLRYVDFDGNRFGTAKIATRIYSFAGTKSIVSLTASPLEHHPNKDSMRAKLIERGAKVEDLSGTRYVAYEGLGWRYTEQMRKAFTTVKGRVVIDTLGWNNEGGQHIAVIPFKVKTEEETEQHKRLLGGWPFGSGISDGYSDPDDYSDIDDDYGIPIDGNAKAAADQLQAAPLDEEQKLICTHLLRGYALKEKMWLNIYANSVQEIQFNTRAFDALVLPDLQKELILGFTATQQLWRNSFDDVISGKGRGIIMLLSGPPGVGKTLTAESVAEEMKVPLYLLSCGELGHDTREVEARLSMVFDMVTRWNAVLLLDESEIFLEERSLENLERNKLVCTFLRVLEYYEGIMFMTTNRVKTIDTAFQSRIHISLDYQELTMESRKQIWRNFLDQYNVTQDDLRTKGPMGGSQPSRTTVVAWKPKAGLAAASSIGTTNDENAKAVENGHAESTAATNGATATTTEAEDEPTSNQDESSKQQQQQQQQPAPTQEEIEAHNLRTRAHTLSKADITDLTRLRLNGRQIRNILKSSQLLANRQQEPLAKRHITTVLEVTQHLHNSTMASDQAHGAIFN